MEKCRRALFQPTWFPAKLIKYAGNRPGHAATLFQILFLGTLCFAADWYRFKIIIANAERCHDGSENAKRSISVSIAAIARKME